MSLGGTNGAADNITQEGIGSSANFTNQGTINIQNTSSEGIETAGESSITFTNDGGTINIDNVTDEGFLNNCVLNPGQGV